MKTILITLFSALLLVSCSKEDVENLSPTKTNSVHFYMGVNGGEYTGEKVVTQVPFMMTGRVFIPLNELKWFEDVFLTPQLRYRVVVVMEHNDLYNTYEVAVSINMLNEIIKRSKDNIPDPNLFQEGVLVEIAPLNSASYAVYEIVGFP